MWSSSGYTDEDHIGRNICIKICIDEDHIGRNVCIKICTEIRSDYVLLKLQ